MEALTDRIETEARALIAEVDALGGAARAIEQGFFQKRIGESAYELQKAIEAGDVAVVGVNRFTTEEPPPRMDVPDYADLEARQKAEVAAARSRRDAARAGAALAALEAAARGNDPLMPPLLAAVRARATLGEVSDRLRAAWGEYQG